MTTEQNQSNPNSHNSGGVKLVSIDELRNYYDNLPSNLLEKALDKIDSNHAKLRSLYRSQLFVESQHLNSDLGIAEGSDCELIQHIGDELKELKDIISKAFEQLEMTDIELRYTLFESDES